MAPGSGGIVTRTSVGVLSLLAFLAIAGHAPPATAQAVPAPSIGVLDVRLILRESNAAKSLQPQIDKLLTGFQQDISNRESALRKAEQELLGQRSILAPEAFNQRRRQFEERAKKAQREVQTRKWALDRAVAVAKNKIRVAMFEIAKDIANEKKINIVMAKSGVLMSKKELEITAETMKRLNQKLPSVKVETRGKK
jgi:Skp family chaperone for outer membrane proteins